MTKTIAFSSKTRQQQSAKIFEEIYISTLMLCVCVCVCARRMKYRKKYSRSTEEKGREKKKERGGREGRRKVHSKKIAKCIKDDGDEISGTLRKSDREYSLSRWHGSALRYLDLRIFPARDLTRAPSP